MRLVLFTLAGVQYGVSADAVVEIVRAVAITPLAGAPAVVEGLIDVRGLIVPVFDLRKRLGLQTRPVDPADHFILVRANQRTAALHVERMGELVDVDERDTTESRSQVPSNEHIAGVATLPDGMAFIHDVATFLSSAESDTLGAAMDARLTNRAPA
ncbi:MAG: chemotaxis protein CheW [Gemmatimonadaceae bacterium]